MCDRKRMSTLIVLAAVVALCVAGGVTPARAQCVVDETAKLLASDGQAGDSFGFSVAISGDRIAVLGG